MHLTHFSEISDFYFFQEPSITYLSMYMHCKQFFYLPFHNHITMQSATTIHMKPNHELYVLKQFETIWKRLKWFVIFCWNHLKQFVTIWNHMKPFETTWNNLKPKQNVPRPPQQINSWNRWDKLAVKDWKGNEIFFLLFLLIWFWILVRNGYSSIQCTTVMMRLVWASLKGF